MLQAVDIRCEYLVQPLGLDVAQPRLSWRLESDQTAVLQTHYQLQVALDAEFRQLVWDSGRQASRQSVHIPYAGPALTPRTRYFVRLQVTDNHRQTSAWSAVTWFETGLLNPQAWQADFITGSRGLPEDVSQVDYFRQSFVAPAAIKSARLYATSLGVYRLSLNGRAVTDNLLTPGWTSYHHRLEYQTYDVTAWIQPGTNVIDGLVGDGWFRGDFIGTIGNRRLYGDQTALSAQLILTADDGSEVVIRTDARWQTAKGPLQRSGIYHGEVYDARLEPSAWHPVGLVAFDQSRLSGQAHEPVRVIETLQPIGLVQTPAGDTVIDFGQNLVGWAEVRLSGPAGARVVLEHAEVLDRDGNFYTANLRSARQTMEYVLRGEGVEVLRPVFAFQGFRYVRVREFPGPVQLSQFTGVVISSAMDVTGQFQCSHEGLNQLYRNILWSLKGNFVDVPTDCPQRDERLGWTGDVQVFARTASFLRNTAPFYTKWLKDLAADQLENGGVTYLVPDIYKRGIGKDSSAAWGDAATIVPWTVYLCFGDRAVLERQFASMKAWVEYIRQRAQAGLLWNTGRHLGDWLALDAKEGSYEGATAKDLISTAFYAYSTELVAKAAQVLGRSREARSYRRLHQKIVRAFGQEFFTPNGRLAVPTQTAHVLALTFRLVPPAYLQRTIEGLVNLLDDSDWHLTTGFVGTPYLCQALSEYGRSDVAYKVLLQTDIPSWLYPITQGATTIWEHWDSQKPDGSFWSPDMNSFNHYAYGAIGDWLFRNIGGIDTSETAPGYQHVVVRPLPGGDLTSAETSLKTLYGTVATRWHLTAEQFHLELEIPANTTATLILPFGTAAPQTLGSGRHVLVVPMA